MNWPNIGRWVGTVLFLGWLAYLMWEAALR